MPDLIQCQEGWIDGKAYWGRFFWVPDIDKMMHKLTEYQLHIHLHRPGAEQALEVFKAHQIEMVTSVREVVSIQ